MDTNPFSNLTRDWAITGQSPTARSTMTRLARTTPLLAAFRTPNDAVLACNRRDGERCHQILRALVHHAPDEPLAARAALQAILPGLLAISRRAQHPSNGRLVGPGRPFTSSAELATDIISTAYERIRTGVDAASSWPATKILDSTAMRIRTLARIHRRVTAAESVLPPEPQNPCLRAARTSDEEYTLVLVDAVRTGVLQRDDAALLYANRVLGHSVSDIAGAVGRNGSVLRRERRRAECQLLRDAS
jgi:hypothetical protein